MKFHFPLLAFLFSAFFFFSSCSGNKNNPEATDPTSTALLQSTKIKLKCCPIPIPGEAAPIAPADRKTTLLT